MEDDGYRALTLLFYALEGVGVNTSDGCTGEWKSELLRSSSEQLLSVGLRTCVLGTFYFNEDTCSVKDTSVADLNFQN